jgi:glutathione S-transferase
VAPVRLYSMATSHPAHAVRAMLDYKEIPYEIAPVLVGLHPAILKLKRFEKPTIPALEIDGRRVQESVAISRELDRLKPDPPLFPSDPVERAAVEEAEAWGDRDLQEYSRRLFRWAAATQAPVLRELVSRTGIPGGALMYRLNLPIARHHARARNATEEQVRRDLAALPAAIDRVDELIAVGTIGADRPNAATFQLAADVRAFSLFEQLWPDIEPRPAGRMALEVFPKWIAPLPVELPDAWLPAFPRRNSAAETPAT